MRLRAGELRHRLTLQYPVETRTASGDVSVVWTTDSTVWGAIKPISGKEYIAASQTQNETDVRVLMRYHATIAPTWRVVNDGLAYSIHSIINSDTRDSVMTLMCSQGVQDESVTDDDTFYVVNSGINVVNSGIQVIST